ncbi:hypothetical protein VNO77_31512 [Canavalia gladiata]|uniref:Uncharacterized protein n=1 Tax=Canavalia gladiata TaxID=3824 RepID=A0AAN9KP05_CANGL
MAFKQLQVLVNSPVEGIRELDHRADPKGSLITLDTTKIHCAGSTSIKVSTIQFMTKLDAWLSGLFEQSPLTCASHMPPRRVHTICASRNRVRTKPSHMCLPHAAASRAHHMPLSKLSRQATKRATESSAIQRSRVSHKLLQPPK